MRAHRRSDPQRLAMQNRLAPRVVPIFLDWMRASCVREGPAVYSGKALILRWFKQPVCSGPGGYVRPGAQAKFGPDVFDVSIDGAFRDNKLCGDGAITVAVGYQCSNLPLA